MNQSDPIIIIGAPRSGTTFLGNLLATHSSLAFVNEPSPVWRYGNEGRSDMLRPEWATPRIREYIRSYFERYIERSGKVRLLEKTPQNSMRMAFVNSVLPDARFIHIMRDPVDTILSIRGMWETNTRGFRGVRVGQRLSEMTPVQVPRYAIQLLRRVLGAVSGRRLAVWGPILPGIGGMLSDLDLTEIAALQWRSCVEGACMFGRTLPAKRYIEVTLEDLDEPLLRRLLDFAGLSEEERLMEFYRTHFTRSRPAGRRDNLDRGELAVIEKWINPTVSWLEHR